MYIGADNWGLDSKIQLNKKYVLLSSLVFFLWNCIMCLNFLLHWISSFLRSIRKSRLASVDFGSVSISSFRVTAWKFKAFLGFWPLLGSDAAWIWEGHFTIFCHSLHLQRHSSHQELAGELSKWIWGDWNAIGVLLEVEFKSLNIHVKILLTQPPF